MTEQSETKFNRGQGVARLAMLAGLTVGIATAAPVAAQDDSTAGQPDAAAAATNSPAIPQHDPSREQNLGDGLIAVDLVEGSGPEVVEGTLVKVDYTGWLADGGVMFDTSRSDDREPFFTSIPGRLIEGWNRGLIGMKAGGKRKLIIPSDLAYGARGAARIPPDSELIFEVELVEAFPPPSVDPSQARKTDDGALIADVKPGEGPELSNQGFGKAHIIVWGADGQFVGSNRVPANEPLLVRPTDDRYWVKYTSGMKSGSRRIVELDDPRNLPANAAGGENGATDEEKGRWHLQIDMVEVTPPIVQTPHNPEDEIELQDGLKIVDLKIGEGETLPEHAIPVIDYSGWLSDGTLFYSTRMPGEEAAFASPGLIIQGWELGLEGMRVGGKRKLFIPAQLGYGERGFPRYGVPANADLVYEVEVVRYEMPLFLPVDPGDDLDGFSDLFKEVEESEGGEDDGDGDGDG